MFVVTSQGIGDQVGQLQQARGIGFGKEGNEGQVVNVAEAGTLNAVGAVVEPQRCVTFLSRSSNNDQPFLRVLGMMAGYQELIEARNDTLKCFEVWIGHKGFFNDLPKEDNAWGVVGCGVMQDKLSKTADKGAVIRAGELRGFGAYGQAVKFASMEGGVRGVGEVFFHEGIYTLAQGCDEALENSNAAEDEVAGFVVVAGFVKE